MILNAMELSKHQSMKAKKRKEHHCNNKEMKVMPGEVAAAMNAATKKEQVVDDNKITLAMKKAIDPLAMVTSCPHLNLYHAQCVFTFMVRMFLFQKV